MAMADTKTELRCVPDVSPILIVRSKMKNTQKGIVEFLRNVSVSKDPHYAQEDLEWKEVQDQLTTHYEQCLDLCIRCYAELDDTHNVARVSCLQYQESDPDLVEEQWLRLHKQFQDRMNEEQEEDED
jgi:hypothetical protein